MKLSKFKFELPDKLIAKKPAKYRDDAKLMVVDREKKTIEHKVFRDILEEFDDGDVMLLNDAKVFPAKLVGNKEKTGARIEVFMLRELNQELRLWDVLVDPARKIRVGNKLFFGDDELVAEVIDNTTSRGRTIRFIFDGTAEDFRNVVNHLGHMPIPAYLGREVQPIDSERFQTIFAKKEGSIAPPSAGLHFTQELMMRLEIKGIDFKMLNLNIGLGGFKPVEVEDLTKHKMDSEQFSIPDDTADRVNKALEEKKKICAVGSSVLRSIESSVSAFGKLNPEEGWTDKFLFPPFNFKIANTFITNFHAPQTTLMMATYAFVGDVDFADEIYKTALKSKYKFLTYGDALLVK